VEALTGDVPAVPAVRATWPRGGGARAQQVEPPTYVPRPFGRDMRSNIRSANNRAPFQLRGLGKDILKTKH